MSNSDRKKKLEELAARRKAETEVAEGSEEEKKPKKLPPKEKKLPTIRSKNKPLPPLKPKGGRAATQNEYEDDGFIVDDEEGDVLDSESQPSSGENFSVSDGPSGSDYSEGVGSSKRKKKKVTTTVKKSKVSSIKKKTTKRKKVESDDEDSSEEEVVKKKSSKKSRKKKGSSDEGELSDIRKDELDELDANQIIKGRRTRGKQIDFRGQDPYDDDE